MYYNWFILYKPWRPLNLNMKKMTYCKSTIGRCLNNNKLDNVKTKAYFLHVKDKDNKANILKYYHYFPTCTIKIC